MLNGTADLYRYVDYTSIAEFLYGCVRHTVQHDLPREIEYLRRHDEAMSRVMDTVEIPDRLAEDLIMFVRQNGGSLSRKRRQSEFEALTDREVAQLEAIVQEVLDGFAEAS